MTEYRDGVWSEPRVINALPINVQFFSASVSMNDRDSAIIVWAQNNSGIYKIEYNNAKWSAPVAVSNSGNARSPQVVINNKAIITWYTDGKLVGN